MVTPALFAALPGRRRRSPRPTSRRRGDRQLDGLLRDQGEEPDRHGAGAASSASAARCRPRSRISSRCPAWAARRATSCAASAFGLPGLPVDTHVGRLSPRLGLTEQDDPVQASSWNSTRTCRRPSAGDFSLRMILHGRRVCDAQTPALRAMRAGGHLPVDSAAARAGARVQRTRRSADARVTGRARLHSQGAGVEMTSPTRFPPPGLRAMPGSAAWRRRSDGPVPGPSPLFRDTVTSTHRCEHAPRQIALTRS